MQTEATMTAEQSIRWNNTRGEFAWWPVESETKWKAINPPHPAQPNLRGGPYDFPFRATIRPNSYSVREADAHATWQAALEGGRSYMVGTEVEMETFIRQHRSALTGWQKIAYAWAMANPLWRVDVTVGRNEWSIYQRGEYVDFCLPHQDAGGEKSYISRDGKSKILVNVD